MKFLNYLSAFIIAVWLAPTMCTERIDPDKIGVRRSIEGGVAEEDFHVGYHLSLPFVHSWYQLDATHHYLEFNEDDGTALDVRTKENNIIFIDLSVIYRIKAGEGWKIVSEGFADSYGDKVKSTVVGLLREQLANMSNLDVQVPDKRKAAAEQALPILNEALEQYHIEATHVVLRGIKFREQYEEKLQNKQYFVVQGRLDEALRKESLAKQDTETLEKGIGKEIALKEEEWNKKIEELKSQYELKIALVEAEGVEYARKKRAEADAAFAEREAEGNLAEAMAEALGERLKAEALSTKAGRTYSAIEAVRRFELGDVQLNSMDATFLHQFGSMSAWRRFFLAE